MEDAVIFISTCIHFILFESPKVWIKNYCQGSRQYCGKFKDNLSLNLPIFQTYCRIKFLPFIISFNCCSKFFAEIKFFKPRPSELFFNADSKNGIRKSRIWMGFVALELFHRRFKKSPIWDINFLFRKLPSFLFRNYFWLVNATLISFFW